MKALHKTVIIFIKKVKFKSFNFALFELFILLLYKAEMVKLKLKIIDRYKIILVYTETQNIQMCTRTHTRIHTQTFTRMQKHYIHTQKYKVNIIHIFTYTHTHARAGLHASIPTYIHAHRNKHNQTIKHRHTHTQTHTLMNSDLCHLHFVFRVNS